jgi:hypothetical protein
MEFELTRQSTGPQYDGTCQPFYVRHVRAISRSLLARVVKFVG